MSAEVRGNDPQSYGHSLANLAELIFPLLDAAGARSVVEIGAYAGDLTRELLEWAAGAQASVTAIEPMPPPALLELHRQHPELELVAEVSHDALRHLGLSSAVIVDGDHNYYTVTEELRLIDEKSSGSDFPLVMLHDMCWPNARRDTYYAPERIPEDHRQPVVRGANLFPGEPGVVEGGLSTWWAAEREGGPRNGTLTAVEDFVDGNEGLRLAVVPAFFGLGVLWREEAPWAGAVADVVAPWDRNPILERLEANRVLRIATEQAEVTKLHAQHAQQEHLLRTMLGSSAFAVGERLSRLRQPGRPLFSREQVRQALREQDAD